MKIKAYKCRYEKNSYVATWKKQTIPKTHQVKYSNKNSLLSIEYGGEESWRLKETCCHLNSSERPPAEAGVINLQEIILII